MNKKENVQSSGGFDELRPVPKPVKKPKKGNKK
jgi:hypothetical protein